ncbi:MAG: SOS response-associated peptidase [Cyanobacteria bacterium P01_F01_bin.42]
MCGRFTLTKPEAIADHFHITLDRLPPPRYNIAPSQPLGVICKHAPREFRLMLWGLIPPWAKDKTNKRLINARAETAHEKPSFRAAFKRKRCLIPATGFYEWRTDKDGKQPFYFHLNHHQLFAFAGLWETWEDIETCTILTTSANDILKPVHHRMPVILSPQDYRTWLSPTATAQELRSLLVPFNADHMQAYPVSKAVNTPTNESPSCIQVLGQTND